MLKVGLTGGIASGKSAVARHFEALGVPVLDADQIAKDQYLKPEVLSQLRAHFGDAILDDAGTLDRSQLKQLIFSEPEAKQWLEDLIHPMVRRDMEHQIQSLQAPYAILEIALLVETLPNPLIDRILLVTAPQASRLQRIIARDQIDATLAEAMMAQQLSDEAKQQHADDILHNDSDLEALHTAVDKLHQQYLDLAR